MNLNKIEKWLTILFISTSIFISVLLAEAIVLTLASQFKALFIYLALIPAFVASFFLLNSLKKDIGLLPKISLPVIFVVFLVSLILAFFPHNTFGGRDESLYSNYAIYLTETASLNLPSYLNNLPNSPTESIKTTPPGYTIYLATQKLFFGTQGLLRGNMIIIIFGFFSFFLVSSYIRGHRVGMAAVILFSSSMPFLWFARETMSENLSFFLLWSLILFLFIFLKTKRKLYIIGLFINAWIFALTRLEGFLIQFMVLIILVHILVRLKTLNLKTGYFVIFFYLLLIVSTIFISKITFSPFLKTVVPQVSYSIKRNLSPIFSRNKLSIKVASSILEENDKVNTLSKNYINFFNEMLAKYNFIIIIFSIFLVGVQFLIRTKKFDKSKRHFFLIFILLIPEYYKLISPNVTMDQPWLYRRYIYALLPFGYLCFSFFLTQLKNIRLLIFLLSILFIINMGFSSPILFLKNNWALIGNIEKITENISKNDLVIINTHERPLGYYSINAFFLLHKNVRILSNQELSTNKFVFENKTFNNISYENIFLLSTLTNNEKNYPLFRIVKKNEIDINYVQLIPLCQLPELGSELGYFDIYNFDKYSYLSIKNYCSKTENEIVKNEKKLYLYELIYSNKK